MLNDYDYNIWGSEVDEISLCAYKQYISKDDGNTYTDTANWYSIVFKWDSDAEEIRYLLDYEEPEMPFTDYDDWVGIEYLTEGHTPYKILEWIGNLPEYEMETK